MQCNAGIWIDNCFPNGTMTKQGWTESALKDFLKVLDSKGVKVVTIWGDDAFLTTESRETCPWFMPALRQWVLN